MSASNAMSMNPSPHPATQAAPAAHASGSAHASSSSSYADETMRTPAANQPAYVIEMRD